MLALFKKSKNNRLTINIPIKGEVIDITEVPDPVFSQKILGDGVAIIPIEERVISPIEGEIIQVTDTKHAIGIKSKNGVEILIHIGLETVAMNGEGFQVHVSEGDRVLEGQLLITFDLDKVKEKAKSILTPVVITNTNETKSIEKSFDQHQWIMKIIR